MCRSPGSNWGPSVLKPDVITTTPWKLVGWQELKNRIVIYFYHCILRVNMMKQVPGVINTPGDPTRLFDSCNRSLVMTKLQDFHTSIMFFVFVKGIFLLQYCLAANSVQNSPFYQGQVKRVRFPHAWKLCTVFCHVHSEYAVIKVDYNPIF